ncbi:MAG: hypothetical protein ACPG49_12425 [Chitinophagales bacterium]
MQQSKLIDLFKTFSPQELKRLEDYLHSPIHNQSLRCQELFGLIKPYFGDLTHIGLAKENIFAQLFPKKKKFDNSLSVLMAQLTKLVQDFLVFLKFEEDKGLQAHWLLSSLMERNLDKHFLRTWKLAEKGQIKTPLKKVNYYYNQYLLTLNKYQYDIGLQKKLSKIDIDQILHDLDLFHLIGQLKYYGALANFQRVLPQKTIPPIPIEAINHIIETRQWQQIPLVQLHHTTLMLLLLSEDSSHFFRLKSFLQSPISAQVAPNDLHDAYALALNYCTQKIVRGEESYRQEMFDLYKSMISQELLYQGGYLSHRKLKNVVSLGVRLQEFEWTKKILKQYLPYINPTFSELVGHFAWGTIYYYQQEYNKAMPHLLQVSSLDIYYAIDARALLLKSYYELNQTPELLDLEKSFKSFIKSQRELSNSRKNAYIHFVKFLVILYRIQHKQLKSRKSLKVLKEDLESTEIISDKQWLMNKITLLEK